MALTAEVVEAYTQGRLVDGDDETERLLAAELLAAQNYCGWHVTPVINETFVLNGYGGRTLILPTLKLVTIDSLSEEGVSLLDGPLSPGDDGQVVRVSDTGHVEKADGSCWIRLLAGITATITHGYDSAPDFESVILAAVDRASQVPHGGVLRAVGPFQYSTTSPASAGSQYTIGEQDILDRYRRNGTFA